MTEPQTFIAVLHADAPAADRQRKLGLYGRFIGDWDTDVITHARSGADHSTLRHAQAARP